MESEVSPGSPQWHTAPDSPYVEQGAHYEELLQSPNP